LQIIAFNVMDDWLNEIAMSKSLPNLKDIVLVGHSAGGQFVQRYAMVRKFEPPSGMNYRYVVSAPSSYAYPSGERFDPRSRTFRLPDAKTLELCPDYDNWGYGLKEPYTYFSDVSPDEIAKRYAVVLGVPHHGLGTITSAAGLGDK